MQHADGQATVSALTAGMLTGKNDRTIRRWCDDRVISAVPGVGKSKYGIPMAEIASHIPVQWDRDRSLMAVRADQGDAEAMNEVALYFMAEDQYELAFPWFRLSAEKGHADAQHWLSKCYFKGWGTEQNKALGLRWLGEAANNGHAIAQDQVKAFNIL